MRDLDDAALERRLRAVLNERLGGLPLDLTVDTIDRRRTAKGVARRSDRGRGVTLLAAAAVLLVGGALAAASGLLRLPSLVPPSSEPSLGMLPSASPDATTTPSASPSPSPTPLRLDLTWTKVDLALDDVQDVPPTLVRLGDRFVVRNGDGAIHTSPNGATWTVPQPGDPDVGHGELSRSRASVVTTEDMTVGWWNPQDDDAQGDIAGAPPITARDTIRIVRPSAAPVDSNPFKGRIESIGVGPRGIVAHVHSDLDLDAWITEKLGLRRNNDWTCCVKSLTFKDGVLELKLDDRDGLRVVWADEGFEPGDIFDGGFGWYSPDGERWTAMAANDAEYPGGSPSNLPTGGLGQVVGVSDGFIVSGGYPEDTCTDPDGSCMGMWFSSDGLTWRLLATTTEARLLPWNGEALAIHDDGRMDVWTSGGATELPIAAQPGDMVATGPLGIVSIGGGQVLVSRDGIDSRVSSMPPEMSDADVIAVGDQTVVVLDDAHSLWLGTFGP